MKRRAFLIVSAVLLTACSSAGGSASSASGSAPFGLATATWPIDATELDAIFAALPDAVSGQPRLDGGYLTAIYGEGADRIATIYAVDLGSAACPGMSGGSLVRSTLEQRGGSLRIADQSPDEVAEGALAYLVGRRDGQQVLGWSVPGAHWVIAIEATSPRARDAAAAAIVSAAVDTSVSASATVAPTASAA